MNTSSMLSVSETRLVIVFTLGIVILNANHKHTRLTYVLFCDSTTTSMHKVGGKWSNDHGLRNFFILIGWLAATRVLTFAGLKFFTYSGK